MFDNVRYELGLHGLHRCDGRRHARATDLLLFGRVRAEQQQTYRTHK
jgi:hypothetical protein